MDCLTAKNLNFSDGFKQVRQLVLEQTSGLLGDTIALTAEDWALPSMLPGWTRSHVAAHLFENALGIIRVIDALLSGKSSNLGLYDSPEEQKAAIERGACLSPLELQIQLDTTAGLLESAFDRLEPECLNTNVLLYKDISLPACFVPLARLNEILLHHLDINVGFSLFNAPEQALRWVLSWNCLRLANRQDYPPIRIESADGFSSIIGRKGEPYIVQGTNAAILGWLTRNIKAPSLGDLPEIPSMIKVNND